MSNRNSESHVLPILNKVKLFQETALGKLISTTTNTDTKDISTLLEAKKHQIQEIQNDITRMSLLDEFPDKDRFTKSKFYLMPSIRKTPIKSVYESNCIVPRPKLQQETVLPEEIEVFWYKMNSLGWKPETRQEATLTTMFSKLYLIGGVSRSINQDVNLCHPYSCRWEKLYPGGVEPEPRFGHSALEYQKKIIVFGGGTNFNTVHKLRECLNGIKIFHPEKNLWEYLKTSGTYISTRKYHCAAIVGKHMFVYGGLNQKNNLLSDCALLNLQRNTWKSIFLEGPEENAFHTAASVLNLDQKHDTSIYHTPPSVSSRVKSPGIYIFGGIGRDKKAHNNLWQVTIGRKPLTWNLVSTQGMGPSPRFLHSIIYNEGSNYLIIFGGRIDVCQTVTYTCYNDVYLLCMQRLLWIRVKVLGDIPTARSGHSATTIGNNLYIFGGVSNTCYCSSDMYVLETESQKVIDMLDRDERKKKFMLEVEDYKARKVKKSHSSVSKNSSRMRSKMSITPSKEYFYN